MRHIIRVAAVLAVKAAIFLFVLGAVLLMAVTWLVDDHTWPWDPATPTVEVGR